MSPILITGCCGFIGFHLTLRLLQEGISVVGIDSINDYYSVSLKFERLNNLFEASKCFNCDFYFEKIDICSSSSLKTVFNDHKPDVVINLAAQAGVRYSLENPQSYIDSNITGFFNILECSRVYSCKHLLYASSSSVYGSNTKQPFSELDKVDTPLNIYAATKKANELFAHSYSNLYGIRTTGLRFFTVYGPWGRPDMALYLFADAIVKNQPIKVFNHGDMIRDFTFVDDIVESIFRLLQTTVPLSKGVPADVFNIGNSSPHSLLEYIHELEVSLGRKADKILLPLQLGDVPSTVSDCSLLYNYIGFQPKTPISKGIRSFVAWFKAYNNLQ